MVAASEPSDLRRKGSASLRSHFGIAEPRHVLNRPQGQTSAKRRCRFELI